ncbi:MAG: DUF6049 family protein [Nocardiopsaceae bacterium]|nr:DUF6049 family protein [Nocardiopsaceae bacterium]
MRHADRAAKVSARLAALAGVVLLALVALTLPAGSARAAGSAPTAGQPLPAVVIEITSISPGVARPRGPVTVSGYLTNTSSQAMAGLTVQLWSSDLQLSSRDAMTRYLSPAGGTGMDQPVASTLTSVPTLPPHATEHWSITLPPGQVGMSAFGVYPLAAQVSQSALQIDAARTFLVYWPGKSERTVLKRLTVAWVWPLIAAPEQAACRRSLLSGDLASAVARRGRLNGLLAAGTSPAARRALVTWAIDPALLSEVGTMTRPFRVGTGAACSGGTARPASTAARTWLAGVRAATARQNFFVTPYADVDVAALTHRGLDSELKSAFNDGRAEARMMLNGRDQRPGGTPGGATPASAGARAAGGDTIGARAGQRRFAGIAWPADGLADYSVLGTLAVPNGIGTVLLDSSVMPPLAQSLAFTPTAVASAPDGVGTQLRVLLTDHIISQVLAAGPTGRDPTAGVQGGPPHDAARAASLATRQQLLAETAMISAESPSLARAVVIAPPRRWDPAPGLASALLAETTTAPWLKPASLAGLASARPGQGAVLRRQPPLSSVSPNELRPSLLHKVTKLTATAHLVGNILSPRQPRYLSTAIAAAASSAWRGGGAGRRAAETLIGQVSSYLAAQQNAVRIIDPPRVTLGGKSGSVPVSVSNRLQHDVRVQLNVSAPSPRRITIGKFQPVITVKAGTQRTIKVPVRAAAAGSTSLTLSLSAPGGARLPGHTATLTVSATHFGSLALVIIGIALGVFLLTSVGRAIRRGRPDEEEEEAGGLEPGETGEASEQWEVGETGNPGNSAETTTSPADSATAGEGADNVDAEPPDYPQHPEEPDEHASAPGRADRR